MSDLLENKEGNLFDGSIPTKDESLDIMSIVKTKKASSASVEDEKPLEKDTAVKKITPLERMMQENEKNNSKGLVATNEELEKGSGQIKDFSMNDERLKSMDDAVEDLNETLRRRAAIVVTKQPKTDQEQRELMYEIDCVYFKENGEAYIDCRDNNEQPVAPKYIRLRTPEDPEFDKSTFQNVDANQKLDDKGETSENNKSNEISAEDTEKKETLNILIDKTGLGINYDFSDEEREKIRTADEILLTEVEELDIETINAMTTDKSYQEVINEYESSNSLTAMSFPASGFRAQMKGLTYGEMSDIILSLENVTFDQYMKRMSVLYNKMINISTGPFKSFEDFLKGISYIDIYLAIYGVYISTYPDVQQISLNCGGCHHDFDTSFKTRSLLRLDKCSNLYLQKMKELAVTPPDKHDEIRKNALVNKSKYIKLPYSKYIVELGIASAYDFIYNVIPLLNEDTFIQAFGEDPNGSYIKNIMLLTCVRSIRVPDMEGKYVLCSNYKDILEAIYRLSPEDMKIISAYYNKISDEYRVPFALENVECPHCGRVQPLVEIDVEDLVFQTYQRLTSTSINVKNIRDF